MEALAEDKDHASNDVDFSLHDVPYGKYPQAVLSASEDKVSCF